MFRTFTSLCLAATVSAKVCTGKVRYQGTFDATWTSDSSSELAYPSSAHFSPLIGTTHSGDFMAFDSGEMASTGYQTVAETGNPAVLVGELPSIMGAGAQIGPVFKPEVGGALDATGSTPFYFMATPEYDMASILTMLAPSPDWVLHGTASLCNHETGKWRQEVTVDAVAYDAGTDSGATFKAEDEATTPAEAISRQEQISGAGSFTFTLKSELDVANAALEAANDAVADAKILKQQAVTKAEKKEAKKALKEAKKARRKAKKAVKKAAKKPKKSGKFEIQSRASFFSLFG